VMADPAGNRTAIVRTPVPAALRAQTAARIMEIEDLRAEQVGFEVLPHLGGAGRLEMMGGEFCGNAARSYGYLLCTERTERPDKIEKTGEINENEKRKKTSSLEKKHPFPEREILIEISGHSGLLKVDCEFPDISFAEMPVPDRIDFSAEGYPLVISEGITHMILENRDPDPDLVRTYVDRYGHGFDAFGMMFLCGDRLTPVVYVREAGSLVYESSCGSGSLAAAWYLAQRKQKQPQSRLGSSAGTGLDASAGTEHPADRRRQRGKGTFVYTFREPGGSISVRLQEDREGRLRGSMGGFVRIQKEITVQVL